MVKYIKTPQLSLTKLFRMNSLSVVGTTFVTLAAAFFAVLTVTILNFDYSLPRLY